MSASKRRGTAFETLIATKWAQVVPGTERRALAGTQDKGDLLIPGEHRFIVEAKCEKRLDLAGWRTEALVEAANAGVPIGVVVHKRRGHGQPGDQWVTLALDDFLAIAYPDGAPE